jgi:serine/threonine-protein kinase
MKNADIIANIVGSPDAAARQAAREQTGALGEKTLEGKEKAAESMADKKKKKIRINKIKVAAAIAALLLAIPVSGWILSGIAALGEASEVEVPDLRGMSVEEAETALEEVGLALKEGDQVIDYDVEEGLIVSQDPEAGSKSQEGKTITVSISKGAREGVLPNLVGKSFQDAVFLLERYGYTQGTVSVEASQMPKDIVIRQSPESGTEAKAGSPVNIVVSEGPKTTLPVLVGMTLEQAKEALAPLGLEVGEIAYEMSDVYAKDIIIWQQELESSAIQPGAKVNLKISTGNEPAGSKSIPLDIDYSRAENQVFYLTVTVNDETGTYNVISREQRIKDNGSEILSLSGTGRGSVTVIFDDTVVMQKTVDFNTGTLE